MGRIQVCPARPEPETGHRCPKRVDPRTPTCWCRFCCCGVAQHRGNSGPHLVSYSGFGSAIIVATPLILATYALMAVAIAGRGTVDLAVGPLLAFINVSVVKLDMLDVVTSPIAVFVVAIGIGILYQLLFALIIIWVRVQPIIVALSGFLALTGINLVILPRPGGTAPEWMSSWGLGTSLFSPVLLILVWPPAAGCCSPSPFNANLRMMGYDERAAFTSGVRIESSASVPMSSPASSSALPPSATRR